MDIRVYNTKHRILNGLFECLKEKPLRELLNQDVIAKSEISSRTFYRYYSDKNAVIDEFENDFTDGLAKALKQDRQSYDDLDHIPKKDEMIELAGISFEKTLHYCAAYKEQGQILLSENGDIKFLWLIRRTVQHEISQRKRLVYGPNIKTKTFADTLFVAEIVSTIETCLSFKEELSLRQVKQLLGQVQLTSPAELLIKNG